MSRSDKESPRDRPTSPPTNAFALPTLAPPASLCWPDAPPSSEIADRTIVAASGNTSFG